MIEITGSHSNLVFCLVPAAMLVLPVSGALATQRVAGNLTRAKIRDAPGYNQLELIAELFLSGSHKICWQLNFTNSMPYGMWEMKIDFSLSNRMLHSNHVVGGRKPPLQKFIFAKTMLQQVQQQE